MSNSNNKLAVVKSGLLSLKYAQLLQLVGTDNLSAVACLKPCCEDYGKASEEIKEHIIGYLIMAIQSYGAQPVLDNFPEVCTCEELLCYCDPSGLLDDSGRLFGQEATTATDLSNELPQTLEEIVIASNGGTLPPNGNLIFLVDDSQPEGSRVVLVPTT